MPQREILLASYWEHDKFYKELALIYPLENPKRRRVREQLNEITDKLNKIDKDGKSK